MPEDSASRPTGNGQEGSLRATETPAFRILRARRLRRRVPTIERRLETDMETVRDSWEEWVLAQAGTETGRYEGTFTGDGTDGPITKDVSVQLEYHGIVHPKVGLHRMLILDGGRAPVKRGVELDRESFSTGIVIYDEERPLLFPQIVPANDDTYKRITWGSLGSFPVTFNKWVEDHSEQAPDFAAVARQELDWFKAASGTLKPSERYR